MSLKLITGPAVEPITLGEVKAHLRIDHDHETAMIEAFITAARIQAENKTNRALISQTWELKRDRFPFDDGALELPRPPLQSVNHIKYIDPDGALQTMPEADYVVSTHPEANHVITVYGGSWPAYRRQPEAVSVEYVAGYGDEPADVPQDIRLWLLLYAGALYENREAYHPGQALNPVPFVNGLLDPYKIITI